MLNGYKTYIAAVGLLGLAVYEFSIGEVDRAVQSALAALAAFGLRQAIEQPVEIELKSVEANDKPESQTPARIKMFAVLGVSAMLLAGGEALAGSKCCAQTRARVAFALANAKVQYCRSGCEVQVIEAPVSPTGESEKPTVLPEAMPTKPEAPPEVVEPATTTRIISGPTIRYYSIGVTPGASFQSCPTGNCPLRR